MEGLPGGQQRIPAGQTSASVPVSAPAPILGPRQYLSFHKRLGQSEAETPNEGLNINPKIDSRPQKT